MLREDSTSNRKERVCRRWSVKPKQRRGVQVPIQARMGKTESQAGGRTSCPVGWGRRREEGQGPRKARGRRMPLQPDAGDISMRQPLSRYAV